MSPSTTLPTMNNISTYPSGSRFRQPTAKTIAEAELRATIAPNVFDYYNDRKRGLIPQCEEPGWGYDHPEYREQAREINNINVAQSFFDVDWNKGFTGRGVDPKYDQLYGEPALVGPRGESVDQLPNAEPPVRSDVRALWKAVDVGENDGINPLYRRPDCDHNEGPFGEKIDDNAIADIANPLDVAIQPVAAAELDPTGEMRDVLSDICADPDATSVSPISSQGEASSETSPETTKSYNMKRTWSSVHGPGSSGSIEQSESDMDYPSKRLRMSYLEKLGTSSPDLPRLEHSKTIQAMKTATLCLEIMDDDATSGTQSDESVPNTNITKDETVYNAAVAGSKGIKRQRRAWSDDPVFDRLSDIEEPRPKRQKREFSEGMRVREQKDEKQKAKGNQDMNVSEDDSDFDDGLFDGIDPIAQAMKYDARPTFFGISRRRNANTGRNEFVPDNNEAGDLVVISVKNVQPREHEYPRGTPRVELGRRLWTEGEEEKLRFWVQDYGIQDWTAIAWCLARSAQDCQEQYRETIMARNKRAGREPNAGLPGWFDPELELTPEELAKGYVARRIGLGQKATGRVEAYGEVKTAGGDGPGAIDSTETDGQPQVVIKSEVGSLPEAEGEEPCFLDERQVEVGQVEALPTLSQAAILEKEVADSHGPPSSRLRVRAAKRNIKEGNCGVVFHDPKSKSFPKLNSEGMLVDPKGKLLESDDQGPKHPAKLPTEGVSDMMEEDVETVEDGEEKAQDRDPEGKVASFDGYGGDDVGRVGRYRHRFDSPSFDGSSGGKVIKGRVKKHPRRTGRPYGIDRKAGRGSP